MDTLPWREVTRDAVFWAIHRARGSMFTPQRSLVRIQCRPLVRKCLADKPFAVILGGAKVSDKMGVIEQLIDHVDVMCIGGAMAYTFLKSQGHSIGNSLFEEEQLEKAKELLNSGKIVLPDDHICGEGLKAEKSEAHESIPDGQMGLDIGQKSIEKYCRLVKESGLIFWNGPMGLFENPLFCEGTKKVAEAIADSSAQSVVGGGDSVSAIESFGLDEKAFDHLSTGGGASLEYIEGKLLPALKNLYI